MKDLTSGKPIKIILLFAIPLFIGQLFQLFYSLADSHIVGAILGETSLAAVGATTTLSDFLIGLLNGFTNGCAIIIATNFGVSQNFIGLTIVAMGTSLPELVTSIVAARKNEVDMALGNVIGSNIFNILLVLGVAAAISPVKFLTDNIIDTGVLIAMSLVVLVVAWTSKMIDRREGATMLGMYAVYMAYICIR